MNRGGFLLLVVLGHLAVTTSAWADTRRIAVIAGNNIGVGRRPPLRFAETDARKMAEVFSELGGVGRDDLFLLPGRSAAELRAALAAARARIIDWRRSPGTRILILFYFSGHSDGNALELGRDLVRFAEIRDNLERTGADMRLTIIDSCKSGSLLALKGGTRGPAFDVRLAESLASTGEALISSSAADEAALESAEIGGSFFSHHLLSGLRGAADASADGLVTLAEAYQYAFGRTVTATANTIIGPQHPVYDYRLSGRGDLVLTRIQAPSAVLVAPSAFERLLVLDSRERVLAELGPQAARRFAVQPGRYTLRAWQDGRPLQATVEVRKDEITEVRPADFSLASALPFRSKGSDELVVEESIRDRNATDLGWRRPSVLAAVGVTTGVARATPLLGSARVAFQLRPGGFLGGVDAGSARADGFRESRLQLFMGAEKQIERGRFGFTLGAEASGGVVWQAVDDGEALWTGVATLAATAGVHLRPTRSLGLWLGLCAPIGVLRREDRLAMVFLPGARLGVQLDL